MSEIESLVEELMQLTSAEFSTRQVLEQLLPAIPVERHDSFKAMVAKITAEVKTLYAVQFTADELRPIIEFYRSDAGKKWLVKMPEIQRAAIQIGTQLGAAIDRKYSQNTEH